jgi:hypothetical protein
MFLTALLWLAFTTSALAKAVLAPRDGDTVASLPTFQFDVTSGYVEVELSKFPETRTAGKDAGAFVTRDEWDDFFLFPEDPRPGTAKWSGSRRLTAGRYYWHAQISDDRIPNDTPTWTPVMRLTVADDPPLVEGWILRLKRIRGLRNIRRSGCPRRVRVSGFFSIEDNAPFSELAGWVLRLKPGAGRRTLFRTADATDSGGQRFSEVFCSNRTKFYAELSVTDAAGHVAAAVPKSVRVRR